MPYLYSRKRRGNHKNNKVSARWMPRLLTSDQKCTRLVMPGANSEMFEADLESFVERFLTQDNCGSITSNHKRPERHCMQWKHLTSPSPKKAKVVPTSGKVMASVFWDAKNIVVIDHIQRSKTINGECYANLLQKAVK